MFLEGLNVLMLELDSKIDLKVTRIDCTSSLDSSLK